MSNHHRLLRSGRGWFTALLLLVSLCAAGAQERNIRGASFPTVRLPFAANGVQAIRSLGNRLPQVAAWYGKSPEEMRGLLKRDQDLWVDPQGLLLYTCGDDHAPPVGRGRGKREAAIQGYFPPDQTFQLHSKRGSARVIYLDFNGHTTSGTAWNSSFTSGADIVSAPFDTDSNPGSFSASEMDVVQYVWKRVAEDFAPFDVDVTTEDPGLEALRRTSTIDNNYGVRVVISPTNFYPNAGGVAYIGSFSWSNDTPAFVFSNMLSNGEKYIAEAVSHEVGHTVGLSHDGVIGGAAYYSGHGTWAPIMGVGYYKEVSQWSKGEYANANNTEDDLAVMQNYGLSYRTDDYGNSFGTARALTGTSFQISGIVEQRGDVDVFSFITGAGTITLNVTPGIRGANLDIEAKLFNASGQQVASSNPTGLSASISAQVPAGTYYLQIDGVGTGDPNTGYTDYGSLGEYTLNGSVVSAGGSQPPTAAASASPTSGNAPLPVAFSSSGSADPDGQIVRYAWNFGDGSTSTAANPSHTYSAAGVYTATLTVTDNDGLSDSASIQITVNNPANQPPVASASANPLSGFAPLKVIFSSAGSSDPDGQIVGYLWTFGNGQSSTSPHPTCTYRKVGTYTATLTVTDNRGAKSSRSLTIVVTQNPKKVLFVQSITMSLNTSSSGVSAKAVVQIRDISGALIPNAVISASWSGLVGSKGELKTNSKGEATFQSARSSRQGTFTLTVTNVRADSYLYDPKRNRETKKSISTTRK
jgi:PKD repeat protein